MKTSAVLLLFALSLGPAALADDSAASIGAGGIIVLKREDRITMAKEVLTIGLKKVKVDYEFRNDTDDDITTGVAFPIPAYDLDWDEHSISQMGFDDFKLTVEGKPIHFQVEARAKLKERDVTDVLRTYGIDVATFGHFSEENHHASDIRKLSVAQRNSLVQAGLIDAETDEDDASWTVEKKYYWTQTFPAHSTVHVSHEYTPVVGYDMVSAAVLRAAKRNATAAERSSIDKEEKPILDEVKSVCLDEGLRSSLEATAVHGGEGYVSFEYVDFILTTANTWKQPIVDFTLFVERPAEGDRKNYVSFCWQGPITKVGTDRFKATANNLIPRHELRIGFF